MTDPVLPNTELTRFTSAPGAIVSSLSLSAADINPADNTVADACNNVPVKMPCEESSNHPEFKVPSEFAFGIALGDEVTVAISSVPLC